jgi:hypothetical protein
MSSPFLLFVFLLTLKERITAHITGRGTGIIFPAEDGSNLFVIRVDQIIRETVGMIDRSIPGVANRLHDRLLLLTRA